MLILVIIAVLIIFSCTLYTVELHTNNINNEFVDNPSPIENISVESDLNCVSPKYKNVGVQAKVRKIMRSKYVQNVAIMRDACCATEEKCNIQQKQKLVQSSTTSTSITSLDDTLNDCDDEYLLSEETSKEKMKQNMFEQKKIAKNFRMTLIEKNPKMYLGIPDNAFFIIKLLSQETGITKEEICLTLYKIKLNDTFSRLGDEFGVSASNASVVFRRTLPILAHYLKQLIVWPSKQSLKMNLPLPFRARYSHVQSIIDCLEIEIQKLGSAVNQSVTWSEYKKCNTLKYLISMSADELINFISEGFCGRTSDAAIVEQSQYLNKLPENCAVMADRGFKNIEHLLRRKGCILI